MKEKYIIPEVHFESFELSESVALGCTAYNDAVVLHGAGYFNNDAHPNHLDGIDCTTIWTQEMENVSERYCYWAGTDKKLLCS